MALTYWDLNKIVHLLEEAARISLSMIEKPETEMKSDFTPVTRADRAVEAFMTRNLEDVSQNCFLVGEETISSKDPQYLEKALQNRVWIIDPIDGTAEFAHQVPFWGNSIGYAENGILKDFTFIPIKQYGEKYSIMV